MLFILYSERSGFLLNLCAFFNGIGFLTIHPDIYDIGGDITYYAISIRSAGSV
jgi:hypothetical protein